uniref:Uncharacterized protein n=1 Tax=Romanomermis culicivorax TaxID=13658 RepID=A0A915JI29_ROMCU
MKSYDLEWDHHCLGRQACHNDRTTQEWCRDKLPTSYHSCRLDIGNPKECDPPFNDHGRYNLSALVEIPRSHFCILTGFVTKGKPMTCSKKRARGFCKLNCINECNTTTLTSVYCPELIRKVPGTFKSELITLVCLCNGTDSKGRSVKFMCHEKTKANLLCNALQV